MPVYTESYEYAHERLERIVARYRYHYSSNYYIRRACDSATRRMTNVNKLRAWAQVLEESGWGSCAVGAYNRIDGLNEGTITSHRRPRLGRTTVPAYVPVQNPLPPVTEVRMVTYTFTVGEEA